MLGDIYEGMRLRYVVEEEPLGTAGPVRLAYDEGVLEERLLVLNGDVLTDIDLTAELAQHERTGARATLALYPVEDTSSYGVVPTDEEGRVEAFLEKSADEPPTNRINAGAYVVEREVVAEPIPAGRAVSFEREVFPALVGEGLYGYAAAGYWIDIGTPRALPRGDLGPARRAACARASRRATRPARSSTRTACSRARTSGRRPCSVATAPSAPTRASSARCSTTACSWARTPRWSRACSPSGCAWASGRESEPGAMVGAGALVGEDAVVGAGAARSGTRVEAGATVAPGAEIKARRRCDERPARSGQRSRPSTRSGMLGDVLAQPLQLGDALWRAESAGIRPRDLPGGLVVCGMGGSAIGGDLAVAALGDRATRPITTVRGYGLESWTPPETASCCARATPATPRRRSPASRPPAPRARGAWC